MSQTDHEARYVMALYYAYGRHDQSIKDNQEWPFEPIAFAEHYAALWSDYDGGRSSSCPSVQDAYDRYRRSVKA